MPRSTAYILKRLLLLLPQIFLLATAVFGAVKLLPGDPVLAIFGEMARPETVAVRRHELGLDLPLHQQYIRYLTRLACGNLGDSITTGQPVTTDLAMRVPASLELLLPSMFLSVALGLIVGVVTAARPGGLVDRLTIPYGLVAGSLPVFYIALLLVYFFYVAVPIAPHPAGRLDFSIRPPPTVTGIYIVDSILAGEWKAFWNVLHHLMLPILTFVFVQAGAVMKMTRQTMLQIMDGDFIAYARLVGLKPGSIRRYALRNALPPVISLILIIFAISLGTNVLIEQVFSWGGLGQYSVQAVVSADYEPIMGFLLATSIFTLVLFILLDILYVIIDPRLEL